MAALNKAHGRANVAISVDDGKARKETVNLGNALPAGFVPPPRSIADIAAILDNEKPDAAKLTKLTADADREPARGLAGDALAEHYYDRATTRSLLGRTDDAIADAEKGAGIASAKRLKYHLRHFTARQKQAVGDLKSTIAIDQQLLRETDNVPGTKGFLFLASRDLVQALILAGDLVQADGYMRRAQARLIEFRTSGHPNMRKSYSERGRNWEGEFESMRGLLLEARGQYRDAEAAYKKASDYKRAHLGHIEELDYALTETEVRQNADNELLNAARMKAKQGRLAEAEADSRAVLLSRLKEQGKYNPATTRFVMGLAGVMIEQGRYADAEKLIRSALDIQRTVAIGDDSQYSAQILSQLGAVLTFQNKVPEAAKVYVELDKAIAKWEPRRKEVLELNGSRITALYASGQIDAGLAAAQELVRREIGRSANGTLMPQPRAAPWRGALRWRVRMRMQRASSRQRSRSCWRRSARMPTMTTRP
jgi:tetratricopeptide (TPR) repeat protein